MHISKKMIHQSNGLLMVFLLALISYLCSHIPFLAHASISALVIAIVLGIIIGNTWHHPASWSGGIKFASKQLLRLAIILYGFRVSFQEIASVGSAALIIDILVVSLTLAAGYFVGRMLFKLDRELSLLISIGAAICGAAAVLAAEDILKSEPYKAAVAVGTVVLFGTAAMFLYSLWQHANIFGFNIEQFGVFAGASVHEVAQALVAGTNVSPEAGQIAVIVKMIRVLLLVPVLFLLSALRHRITQRQDNPSGRITIPWFAIFFVMVIGFNSLNWLPETVITAINQFDTFLLTMAMGAIGIETKLSKVKKVGMPPLYLASFLFVWLVGGTYSLVKIFV